MMSKQTDSPGDVVFFLGGRDLEMETIRRLLERHAPGRFADARLEWGAKASAYKRQIEQVLAAGKRPALVELQDDLGLDGAALVIDHHGDKAGRGRATALEQVFSLLGLPAERWDRWLELVSANDRAHLVGLREVGATREEMCRVREADRRAQGVTPEQEADAEAAARRLEQRFGGRLKIADLPHGRTAPLVDRLAPELGGPGFETLIVRSPGEVNVFGPGWLIEALGQKFPSGWYGGNLPVSGFFGSSGQVADVTAAAEKLVAAREPDSYDLAMRSPVVEVT